MKAFILTLLFLLLAVSDAAAQNYETIGILQPIRDKKNRNIKNLNDYTGFIETPLDFKIKVDAADLPKSEGGFLLTITVASQELVFEDKNEIKEAFLHLFVRVLSKNRRDSRGFEEKLLVKIDQSERDKALKASSTYRKVFELPAGNYKIDVVLRDINSGNRGIKSLDFEIPDSD